tara:strand:+ start:901 stop:1485 length:585 start_codon:yes stop_codon:yes gene_type:complete
MSSNQSNENTINNAQDPLAAALPDRPMTDSYYKAKSFMDALNKLLDIIENIPDLTDGEYLTACNALKTLNDNKTIIIEQVRNTSVVVEQTQAVRRARRVRIQRSDEDRIRLGIAERCSKCERVISKKEDQDCGVSNNLKQHKERDICHNIFSAKRLAIRVGVADISLYQNIINTIRKWAIKTGKWSPNRRRFYE